MEIVEEPKKGSYIGRDRLFIKRITGPRETRKLLQILDKE
jgi:hypothetical protein